MNEAVLFSFYNHMDTLPIYKRLEEMILPRIPNVKIKVQKSQVMFTNKRVLACASFRTARKAKDRPKAFLPLRLDDRIQRNTFSAVK